MAVGAVYLAEPRASIGKKIGLKKINPSVVPVPLPKLVESLCVTIIAITKLTNGMKKSSSHHPGFPTIFSVIYALYTGIKIAQPGWPALTNSFQPQ